MLNFDFYIVTTEFTVCQVEGPNPLGSGEENIMSQLKIPGPIAIDTAVRMIQWF